jgi:hypothetical protein
MIDTLRMVEATVEICRGCLPTFGSAEPMHPQDQRMLRDLRAAELMQGRGLGAQRRFRPWLDD